MKSVLILAAGMVLGAQASPTANYVILNGTMPPLASPATPKPLAPPAGFAPAPLPNIDLVAPPSTNPTPKGQPEVDARLSETPPNEHPGAGYAPGSTFSNGLERKSHGPTGFAPSINFKMPLY